jgi:predicted MFS family arabinose efflux permease
VDQRGRGVPGGNGELPAVFWRLAAVMVPNRLGMFVAPFLTYYLAAGLHLGAGRVAIVMTAFGAGWAAGPPVAGHLADRLGRRGVIVATQVAAAAAYYGLGQARTLPQLAGGAVAVGLLFDGWRAPATAIVYDACAGQAQQARAMTRLFWMQNVGLIGSSVGAGVLAVTAGWQWLFAGNAIASVVFAAASWLALPPSRPAWAQRSRSALADPVLAWFTVITLIAMTIYSQVWYALPLRFAGTGIAPVAYGVLSAANPLTITVLQGIPPVQRRIETLQPVWACSAGIALIGGGVALTGLGRGLTWFLALSTVWTAGEVLFFGPGQAVAARLSPPGQAGGYLGSWAGALGLSMLTASVTGSWLIRAGGLPLLWEVCAGAGAAAAAGCLVLLRSPRLRDQPRAAPPVPAPEPQLAITAALPAPGGGQNGRPGQPAIRPEGGAWS